MADIIELEQWEEGIYQLEEEDLVLGGPDGIDNLQAKQLANRTKYLKALVEALGTGKQPIDAMLTALAALVTANNQMLYFTGPDAPALTTLSAFARTLLDDADAAAARTTLGAAPLASPTFTGTPAAPTPAAGTNTTQLATTAFVQAAVAAIVASSPAALDTLNELAAALGDDPNFATTMTNALAGKQPLDATLTALAAVVTAADKLIYATGADTFATATLTAFARTLLDDADAATMRATLGAQAADATLAALAAVATAANKLIYATGADAFATTDFSAFARTLLDDADAATARGTLGLSTGFASNTSGNGYLKLPDWLGGFIFQWGSAVATYGGTPVTYPIAFPNGTLFAGPGIASTSSIPACVGPTASGFTFYANTGTSSHLWFAIGY